MTVTAAYGMEGVALRLFNVYGPGQALSNPYTGVLAIFASRLANGKPPMVFEDGLQRRDFVHVDDVARSFRARAGASRRPPARCYNIGSGRGPHASCRSPSCWRLRWAGPTSRPRSAERRESGDIRHCFADIDKATRELGFRAQGTSPKDSRIWPSGWRGQEARGPRRRKRAASWKPEGWSHERRRGSDARLVQCSSREARVSSAATSPTGSPERAACPRPRLTAAARDGAQSSMAASAPPGKVSIGARRHPRRIRGARSRAGCLRRFPLRRTGGCDHESRRADGRFRGQCRRDLRLLEALRRKKRRRR